MTDVKTVTASAVVHNATITQTQEITSNPTTPVIVAQPSETGIVVTNYTNVELVYNTTNMGEESVPDPTLWIITRDAIGVLDPYITKLIGKNSSEILSTSVLVSKLVSKQLIDAGTTSDVLAVYLEKVLTDTADATDDFYGLANPDDDQIASVIKSLIDYTALPSDTLIFSTLKYLDNIAATTSITEFIIDKSLDDTTQAFDLLTRVVSFNRQVLNTATTNSLVSILTEKTLDPDSVSNISDLVLLLIDKNFEHTVSTSDYLVTLTQFVREIVDIADATDDFYGLANPDDDQIATVIKSLIDYSQTTSSVFFNILYSVFPDTGYAQDQLSVTFEKLNFDQASLFDSDISFVTDKYVENIQNIIELIGIEFTKDTILDSTITTSLTTLHPKPYKSDTTSNVENITRLIEPLYSDQLGLISADIKDVGKVLAHTASVVEFFSYLAELVFIDTASTQDLAAKIVDKATTDSTTNTDSLITSVGKLLQHVGTTVELISKLVGKSFDLDQTSLSDLSTILTNKAPSDTVNSASTILNFIVDYHLFDIADATDDLDLTNTDDDQTASFIKVLATNYTYQELFDRLALYYRNATEVLLASDLNTISTTKALVEPLTSTDLSTVSFTKPLVENKTATDLFNSVTDFQRTVNESKTATDTSYLTYSKLQLEPIVSTEIITKLIVPGKYQESLTAVSNATKQFNKSLIVRSQSYGPRSLVITSDTYYDTTIGFKLQYFLVNAFFSLTTGRLYNLNITNQVYGTTVIPRTFGGYYDSSTESSITPSANLDKFYIVEDSAGFYGAGGLIIEIGTGGTTSNPNTAKNPDYWVTYLNIQSISTSVVIVEAVGTIPISIATTSDTATVVSNIGKIETITTSESLAKSASKPLTENKTVTSSPAKNFFPATIYDQTVGAAIGSEYRLNPQSYVYGTSTHAIADTVLKIAVAYKPSDAQVILKRLMEFFISPSFGVNNYGYSRADADNSGAVTSADATAWGSFALNNETYSSSPAIETKLREVTRQLKILYATYPIGYFDFYTTAYLFNYYYSIKPGTGTAQTIQGGISSISFGPFVNNNRLYVEPVQNVFANNALNLAVGDLCIITLMYPYATTGYGGPGLGQTGYNTVTIRRYYGGYYSSTQVFESANAGVVTHDKFYIAPLNSNPNYATIIIDPGYGGAYDSVTTGPYNWYNTLTLNATQGYQQNKGINGFISITGTIPSRQTATALDIVTKNIQPYKSEQIATPEEITIVMLYEIAQLDETNILDTFNRVITYNRSFLDSAIATDDLYGAATVDDEQSAQVFKTFLENQTTTEIIAKLLNKQPSDNVATQETRSAHIQDYFATSDYVDKTYLGLTPTI